MPAYKDKNTGKWYCQFYYHDWTGKNRHKVKRGFNRKKDAEQWELEFLNTHQTNDISLKQMLDEFLVHIDTKVALKIIKPTTAYNYKCAISFYVIPYFPISLKLSAITPKTINTWLITLSNTTSHMKKRLNNNTILLARRILSQAFDFAVKNQYISENPVKKSESLKSTTATKKIWTLEEYQRFYDTIDKPAHRIIYNLMFFCGLRIGEVLALSVQDFNRDTKSIHIKKTIMRIGYEVYVGPAKSAYSIRELMLPNYIYNQLCQWIDSMYKPKKTDRLFPLSVTSIYHMLKRRIEKLNLPVISLHGFRHSNASMLYNLTKDITLVSHNLGHKNPHITWSVYSHMIPGEDKNAAALIEALMENQPINTIDTTANEAKNE